MSSTRSKDRSSDCSFTFADGRRCRMPRQFTLSREGSGHPFLCCFHARKEAQAQAAEEVGHDVRFFLSGDYLSACNLSLALGRVFAATAQGKLKPKTAGTLAYLGQTLLQTIHLAENEYINAFSTDRWRRVIHSHVNENSKYLFPAQTTQQLPLQPPGPEQPDASVEAGRNLSRPGRETGSSSTAATRLSAQPSTQASSATHEGFTLSPEGTGSSSPISRPARRNLSQPSQEPDVSKHSHVSPTLTSSTADSNPAQTPALISPSPQIASLLPKEGSSAPPQLPRSGAEFAATILASADSTAIPSQPLSTEHATVSVGAGLPFTLRHEGFTLSPEGPALSSPRTPRPSRLSPVAKPAAPSQAPSSQNPKPAATPPTGPSGAPLLAALPPRNPAPAPTRPSDSSPTSTPNAAAAPPTPNCPPLTTHDSLSSLESTLAKVYENKGLHPL